MTQSTGPAVYRTDRRLLCWPAVLVLLGTGSGWLGLWLDLTSVGTFGIVLVVFGCHLAILLLRGRVGAGPDGLTIRWYRTVVVPWSRVMALDVVSSRLETGLRLRRRGTFRALVLPAPRSLPGARDRAVTGRFEHLLAHWRATWPDATLGTATRSTGLLRQAVGVAFVPLLMISFTLVAVDRPWIRPWWPGVHEASALPNPCRVLDDALRRRAVSGLDAKPGFRYQSRYSQVAECRWSALPGNGTSLVLRYERKSLVATDSGTDEAASFLRLMRRDAPALPGIQRADLAGVGDDAVVDTGPMDSEGGPVWIYARRANVLVTIDYTGLGHADTVRATAVAVARRAVGTIRLD